MAKLNEKSESWRDYPHLVKWVEQMKKWVVDYQIYEFIAADDDGRDPSGRIPELWATEAENVGKIESRFIWTDHPGDDVISSSFTSGSSGGGWNVSGWYVGRVPHDSESLYYDSAKRACNRCQGSQFFENSEGEEEDCDLCWDGKSEYVFLQSIFSQGVELVDNRNTKDFFR